MVRYKAKLFAQDLSQRLGIDYEETYSPIMNIIMFHYLITMAVKERLDLRFMDVMTTYLYGKLDNDIYMRVPEGLKIPKMGVHQTRNMYSIKLQRSLYGLRQFRCMWYNQLSESLLKKRICERRTMSVHVHKMVMTEWLCDYCSIC